MKLFLVLISIFMISCACNNQSNSFQEFNNWTFSKEILLKINGEEILGFLKKEKDKITLSYSKNSQNQKSYVINFNGQLESTEIESGFNKYTLTNDNKYIILTTLQPDLTITIIENVMNIQTQKVDTLTETFIFEYTGPNNRFGTFTYFKNEKMHEKINFELLKK